MIMPTKNLDQTIGPGSGQLERRSQKPEPLAVITYKFSNSVSVVHKQVLRSS